MLGIWPHAFDGVSPRGRFGLILFPAISYGCRPSLISASGCGRGDDKPPSIHRTPATVRQLKDLLRRIDGGVGAHPERQVVTSGLGALDALLPDGGLPAGAVTEILHDGDGTGAASLALRFASRVTGGGHVVLIDPPGAQGDWYPPALAQSGLPLERVVLIRADSRPGAMWAAQQSLRCRGVSAVVATFRHIESRASRMLQLAAESGGGVGLILRSAAWAGAGGFVTKRPTRTFAAVQLYVECGSPGVGPSRRIHVLRTPAGCFPEPPFVEWRDETRDVPEHAVAGGRTPPATKRAAGA